MNTRFSFFRILVALFLLLPFVPMGNVSAAAPDVIGLYKVSIQNQSDGSMSMRYEFTHYKATTDFPSADFYIGLPNPNFTIDAVGGDLSGDTGWVTGSHKDGFKAYINFRSVPKAGQDFEFWYEIHLSDMAHTSGDNVSFQYQPSWFDFATITRLEIWWKLPTDPSLVVSLTPEPASKQDGWAVWTYDNMSVNAKTDMLNLLFTKTAFPNFVASTSSSQPSSTPGNTSSTNGDFLGLSCLTWIIILFVILVVIVIIAALFGELGGGGSGGGSGGGGGGFFGSSGVGGGGFSSLGGGSGGSSGHSSGCAGCAGCACACAGGGR